MVRSRLQGFMLFSRVQEAHLDMTGRTMTVIHSENILLENIYVNSTDVENAVGFGFSSLNVRASC